MLAFQDGTVTIKLDEQKLGNAYAWTNYTVEVRSISSSNRSSRSQSCQYLQAVLKMSVLSESSSCLFIFFCFDLITEGSFTQDFIMKILKIFYN